MSVWTVAAVEKEPELSLIGWRIYEVARPLEPHPTRHLVGYSESLGEGRATSAIQELDPGRATLRTKSGRIYYLDGAPGWNGEADHVWRAWKRINSATEERDLTAEVYAAIQAAAPPPKPKARRKRPGP